ncbi:MAG: hypothetical protein ACOX9R_09895 [Armatimonadota bacterium]|jgi:hypothetical protein
MRIGRARSRCRRGTVLATALAFAGAALLLVWLALNSLLGPYAGTPRRQALAAGSITLAAGGFAVSVAVVVTALRRRRRLLEHMRPGEQIVGTFPAEIVDLSDDGAMICARSVGLTLTNQRLLIHEPEQDVEPKVSLEHDEIASALDRGPTPGGHLRRCVLHELALRDGRTLCIQMDAATSIDFMDPRRRYLEERVREMRALILHADGPTPSRPAQSLDTILADGRPTVSLLELDENYLRITGEHSTAMGDLYYYFHWDHMTVGALEPARVSGLPEAWVRLRLQFHDTSSLVVCGSEDALSRIRHKALSAGAARAPQGRSPDDAG